MYYVLACYGPDDEDRAAIGAVTNTDVNWQLGQPLVPPPPVPVMVDLDPAFPGMLMPMFDKGILLFSKPMLASLEAAGVDNLDAYDAVLRDPATGNVHREYQAVNIIGLVAAADLAHSVYEASSGDPMIDTDFDSLAIDEQKAAGLRMFRLAEAVTAIVIREDVRKQLERDGIPHLDFIEPADWIG